MLGRADCIELVFWVKLCRANCKVVKQKRFIRIQTVVNFVCLITIVDFEILLIAVWVCLYLAAPYLAVLPYKLVFVRLKAKLDTGV